MTSDLMPAKTSRPFGEMPPAARDDAGADDSRSIGEAMRATLLFLAIIGFLLWAGVAESQPAGHAVPVLVRTA